MSEEPAPKSSENPSKLRSLSQVYALGLQGDMKEGLKALEAIPTSELSEKNRATRQCLLERFSTRERVATPKTTDEFLAGLIPIYEDYWTKVLLREKSTADGEEYLFQRLAAYLAETGVDVAQHDSLDALVGGLGNVLEKRGYRSIRGVTRPYYELMAWKTESTKVYDVELPETTITVDVVFMDDFATLGWSAFATCDTFYSGGWAKDNALYCVKGAWDIASENFLVSYLSHEAQHFADYRFFPKLEQPELEYRAKLTELAKANETVEDILAKLVSNMGTSRAIPHSFANSLVIRDLSKALLGAGEVDLPKLKAVGAKPINERARGLLRENTAKLKAAGAETVKRLRR